MNMRMEFSRLPMPVLTYHKIGTPKEGDSHPRTYLSEASFARQMKTLAFLGYQTVSPVDLLALKVAQTKPPCRKPILLTFDDASVTVHATAWPIMKRYGFTGTVFITYQGIGKSPAWDNDSRAGYQIGFATDFGDGSLAAIPRRTVKQGKLFLRELWKAKRLSLR